MLAFNFAAVMKGFFLTSLTNIVLVLAVFFLRSHPGLQGGEIPDDFFY